MTGIHRYLPGDRMADLISENYFLIQVISRFGIKVGFGDKTVEQVCREFGVDCATFLAVVNFIVQGHSYIDGSTELSIPSLLNYLKQSHIYFLEFCLPAIRRKLLNGIVMSTDNVSFLIMKFFDDYTAEVKTHMEFEEQEVFSYVRGLLSGSIEDKFRITTYSEYHEEVGDKLKELKNIIIKYCPDSADINLLNDALYDIYRCEQELESHCMVEDRIFVPAVVKLERKVREDVQR